MVYPAIGTVIGCWLGVIPIALDWDRPWQVRVFWSDKKIYVGFTPEITGMAADTCIRRYLGIYTCFHVCVDNEFYELSHGRIRPLTRPLQKGELSHPRYLDSNHFYIYVHRPTPIIILATLL